MKYSIIPYLMLLLTVVQTANAQQTNNQNYILSRTFKQAGADPNDVSKVVTQVQYLDGLGRPAQTVTVSQSPSGEDIVQPMAYDAAGRQPRQYLPYVAPAGGTYRSSATADVSSWYLANPAGLQAGNPVSTDLDRPFTETTFDTSPLSRPVSSQAPGSRSRPATIKQKINKTGEVKRYDYIPATNSLLEAGYFGAGTLIRMAYTDEQGIQTNEYTDRLGQTICKSVVNGAETLYTYYIFDELGLLRAVLQPGYQDLASPATAFLYDYDNYGRMIKKQVPGAGVTEIVYDKYDRPALSRDALQLARGVWGFTKYDALNRPVVTGELTSSWSQATWAVATDANTTHHEERNNGTSAGYTLGQTAPINPGEASLLTITFYDDYAFSKPATLAYAAPAGYTTSPNATVKAQVTGHRTRMLPGNGTTGQWLTDVLYYDGEYRPIQTARELYDLGANAIERVSTLYKYDLAPVIDQQKTEQLVGGLLHSHLAVNTYDHADRLLNVKETVTAGTKTKTAYTVAQRYNVLGQLQSRWFHGYTIAPNYYRRRTQYTYNIRGWVTAAKTAYQQNAGTDLPFYGISLAYENPASPGKYSNGNISSMLLSTKDETTLTQGMSFSYDGANRLLGSASLGSYADLESGISYDKNGNIKTLTRSGTTTDNLTYTYTGNQLKTITDASGSNSGVKAGTSSYAYDANGNMISDGNRGATLNYNLLNLPKTVVVGGKTLVYDYDASGTKHKYVADTLTVKYARLFEYDQNNVFKRAATSEGQAVPGGDTLRFEYYLKDHLGNVRVVFDESGKVLQETGYYPFGLEIDRDNPVQTPAVRNGINRYNFLGKETQVATGYIDLQARFYDPAVGRFMQVDPETEGQDEFSPYHYSFNNPIRFSDPDGRWPECCGGIGDFLTGLGSAVNDNMGWGNPVKAQPGYVSAYNSGRTVGHYLSAGIGAAEIAGGTAGLTASAAVEVGSAGLATPVVAAAVTGSATLVAHGGNTAMNAMDNLKNDKGRVNADSHPNSNKTSGNNSAAQTGKQKHKELAEKVNQKPGWKSEPSIVGKDGKTYKPDVQTPSGNLLEYKPKTPTGVSKGKTQAKNYENQTGQKTRVIYYEN